MVKKIYALLYIKPIIPVVFFLHSIVHFCVFSHQKGRRLVSKKFGRTKNLAELMDNSMAVKEKCEGSKLETKLRYALCPVY